MFTCHDTKALSNAILSTVNYPLFALSDVSFRFNGESDKPGIFFAILERGPRAFQTGKISVVNH